MPRSKPKIIAGSVVGLLIAMAASGWILPREYPTEQTANLSFVLDENFTQIRKILVRSNATQNMVTMGGDSELLEQTWSNGDVDAEGDTFGKKILQSFFSGNSDWKLKLNGILKVRTSDEYIGEAVVTLHQEVEIKPDHLQSEVTLAEGSERLLGYTLSTRLARDGDQTTVQLQLTQEIKTDAPWFAHAIADRRVLASAEQTLSSQEQAMRQFLVENADKAGLFPLQ